MSAHKHLALRHRVYRIDRRAGRRDHGNFRGGPVAFHSRGHRSEKHVRDLARPGHVFPLRAREGGVLVRAGQTEAAVDLARMCGLQPGGVICEIMNADGSMARVPHLAEFCARHGLKMISVAELIRYRLETEHFVERARAKAAWRPKSGFLRRFNMSAPSMARGIWRWSAAKSPEEGCAGAHALALHCMATFSDRPAAIAAK